MGNSEIGTARRKYPDLTPVQRLQIKNIAPSKYLDRISYRPCRVTLDDGSIINAVYIVHAQEYIDIWGVWPDEDEGKQEVSLTRVVEIAESPLRLPPSIATRIYESGESGMGYHVFRLVFDDGSTQSILSGGAVDFVRVPQGKSLSDLRDVIPHEGRDEADPAGSIDYFWCLYGEGLSNRGT